MLATQPSSQFELTSFRINSLSTQLILYVLQQNVFLVMRHLSMENNNNNNNNNNKMILRDTSLHVVRVMSHEIHFPKVHLGIYSFL